MRAQQVTPSSPFCGGEGERIVPGGLLRFVCCHALLKQEPALFFHDNFASLVH